MLAVVVRSPAGWRPARGVQDVVATSRPPPHEQAKRQRQLAETVDLSGESDELPPPSAAQENRGPQAPQAGPVRVKAEATA